MIMNRQCTTTSEQELEKITNKRFILVTVYLKPQKQFVIPTCRVEGKSFISEEIANTFDINAIFKKRIRVDGEIYLEVTEEELNKIKKDYQPINVNVVFQEKLIVPSKKPPVEEKPITK